MPKTVPHYEPSADRATASDYSFEVIRDEAGFQRLEGDWRRLHEAMTPKSPFLSYEWSRAWWEHLCPPATPYLVTVRSAERLVGLAPLRLERKWGMRMLRFLADGRADYLGFLVAPGDAAVPRLLIEQLRQCAADWDIVLLRQLCEEYANLPSMDAAEGLRRSELDATVAPCLSLQGDGQHPPAAEPGRLRQARRKYRSFLRGGGVVEYHAGRDLALMAEDIARIEAHSWKHGTSATRFQTTPEQNMLRQVLTELGLRKEVEVILARLDGVPIAYLLNFLSPDRTCNYQCAYDQGYGQYSPGALLHFCAIEKARAAGHNEYDFMIGNEGWKSEWANQQRTIKRVALYQATPRGHLAFLLLLAPRWFFRRFRVARALHRTWREIRSACHRRFGR